MRKFGIYITSTPFFLIKNMTVARMMHVCYTSTMTISLRITDPKLEQDIRYLMDEHNLSANMTVQMLLGYAFNQIDAESRVFTPKVVFESKSV